MSVQLTSSLDQVTTTAMSPITSYPQSAGGAEPFSSRAKRATSPQRISNGYTSTKSNGILSPRKTSKRFFRRPTLEKSPSIDTTTVQSNEKKKQSAPQPKVEIIYKDSPQSENESEESKVASLKKTFEMDGSSYLRPVSTHSGERTPSTISDESAPSAVLLGVQGLDVNMNRISTGSSTSYTERVVQEILATEQAYVQHLHEIIEGYLNKMRKQNSPFPVQDVKDLFMNIEEIYEFNKTFLAELEECGDDPVDVASHFVSKEKGFKTYTDYCTNYPVSMEVLTKSTQQKDTADFIKKIQVELGHSLPLGSYLLKPVQRILKYHLLLQDIQKHFDKESRPEGYEVISDALAAMTGVAHHINEMKRQHEVAVHVQEIQSQMSDFEGPDLTTYGSLVLEDTFRMHGTRTDRFLFLFEKILLITKRKETGYSCKATLMLSNMMLLESVHKEPLAFEIIRFDNQKITYTFLARNADLKHKWTLELKRLIVDSLAASVPSKAKALILGKDSVEEKGHSETESEGRKRSESTDKLRRGKLQLKAVNNSRILVTVTADYVDVKRLRISYSSIHQIIQQTANHNSELELRRLDRVAHELANRNACYWLYQTVANQFNSGSLEAVNRRNSDPFQGNLRNKMNLNSKQLNVESLSGFSSIPRNFSYSKGSAAVTDWKKKQEINRKSDDENEPRSPSDAYSSDDDKKPVRPHSLLSDREEDLEECDETTEDDSGVSSEPGSGHVEQRLSSNDLDDDDKEEKSPNPGPTPVTPAEQTTRYSVHDAQGEVLGTATAESGSFVGTQDDTGKNEQSTSPEKDVSQENTVKRIPPVPRKRSSSLSKCEALRNKNLTGMSDDEAASERARADLTRARSDSPNQARRTSGSGHRLLEARLSAEKSSSARDLRGIEEDSPAVFSHEITSFKEYSAIQTTVRKVSRAFSGSSPPAEKSTSTEAQMHTAQARYIEESRGSPDKNTSLSSSDSSQNNLEELLASIDRDLDETRRTISYAQLLESALLIKNDSQPLATEGEPTDTLRRRRRPRIIDFSVEKGDSQSNESNDSTSIRNVESVQIEHEKRGQDEADASANFCQKPHRAIVADFAESTNGKRDEESRQAGPAAHSDSSAQENHVDSEPQDNQGVEFSPTIENTPVRKRVFELFADGSNDKSKQFRNVRKESSSETEPAHVITPSKPTLPNVYQMARQYSQKVTDKETVNEIRMRTRSKLHGSVGSITFQSGDEDTTDRTPKIKVEKITKVSFTSTPIESYKLVRRRRRRSGSSRHRSDDFRRQSWSVEKVKPDSDEPRKERPKSVYDIEALEATLTENLEQIEEGLEPMLIEGLEKDDVVVRGLVQHLVNKFNTQKNKTT